MKNHRPNFKQLIPCGMRMKNPLMLTQSHTKTAFRGQGVKLNLKYRWYHHHDVMQFSTLNLPKPDSLHYFVVQMSPGLT